MATRTPDRSPKLDDTQELQGLYGPFFNPVPEALNHSLLTEQRNGLEIEFDFDAATMHIIRFVARTPLSTGYLEDVLEDARRRAEDPDKIDDLVALFDSFVVTEQGEEVLAIIESMAGERMITGDNPTLLRRLALVAGSIVWMEHGIATTSDD